MSLVRNSRVSGELNKIGGLLGKALGLLGIYATGSVAAEGAKRAIKGMSPESYQLRMARLAKPGLPEIPKV